jgi:hypothetical protein
MVVFDLAMRYCNYFMSIVDFVIATPQVTGLVATHLSSTPISDQCKSLQGSRRRAATKDYLFSDRSSHSREKDKDLRGIWNGALKNITEV